MPARPLRSALALVTGVLVVAPMAAAVGPAEAAEACAGYSSPLECAALVVGGDLALEFDGEAGGLADKNAIGTGFRLVQPSSAPPEYLPQQLEVTGGVLRDTSTAGIQFTTNNTLDNGLGVALPTPVDPVVVSTTVLDVPTGMNNQAEQGGLWLGSDQDNLVKLVAVSRASGRFNIQLAREVGGVVGTVNEVSMPTASTFPAGADVTLSLTVDPVAGTATGRYALDGGATQTLGTLPLPPGVLTGLNPAVPGAGTATGIFSTARNRTVTLPPVTWSFDRFSVDVLSPPAAPGAVTATPGDDEVALVWEPSTSADVTGYQVFRGTSPVATTGAPLAEVPAGTTSWTDSTLLLDVPAAYAVRAVRADGTSSQVAQSGTVTQTGPAGEPYLRVDVVDATPASNPGPVDGWLADSGLGYDDQRGYGWLSAAARPERVPVDASLNTRQRPGLVAEWGQRRAGLIHLQYGDVATANPLNGIVDDEFYWEAAVPAGRYAVAVAVGDDGGGTTPVFDATHTVDVEGVSVVEGFVASVPRVFDEAVVEVDVTDGFLTVSVDRGTNTKIASIEITQLELTPPADTTPPAVPTGLTGTADDGSLALGWDAVVDEDLAAYRVYVVPAGSPVDLDVPAVVVTEPAAVVDGLSNGTSYDVTVAAVDASGNASAASAPATLTPLAPEPVDTTPPAVPTGLAGTAGDGSVSLTWTGVVEQDLAGYRVYAVPTGTAVDLADPAAEVTVAEAVLEGLTNETSYDLAVASVDAAGNVSALSATTTLTPTAPDPVDTTPPAVPSGLAVGSGDGQVTLTWQPVADASSYLVLRGTLGVLDVETPVAEVSDPTWTDTDVVNGVEYVYAVIAVDDAGNRSLATAPVAGTGVDPTVLQAPTGLVAELDGTTATLSAGSRGGGDAVLRLYRRGAQLTGTGFDDTLLLRRASPPPAGRRGPGAGLEHHVRGRWRSTADGDDVGGERQPSSSPCPRQRSAPAPTAGQAEYFAKSTSTGVPGPPVRRGGRLRLRLRRPRSARRRRRPILRPLDP